MKTRHGIIFEKSQKMGAIPDGSVNLIVTSPPYPMIEMWDEIFCHQNKRVRGALERGAGLEAFELMHSELDLVWEEAFRVLADGGFACINIGDATRTINDNFQLYPNHSRILQALSKIGFNILPDILWRKQTNSPNKFMGSGMLPAGAYVTLEHEYILIARKGGKRKFTKEDEKSRRRESAIFWEERNTFFSDVWFDVKGTVQKLVDPKTRKRSGAFPFELAYRLINMYSVKNDMVLDPFMGCGTTMAAAMAACRNSTGFEIDPNLRDTMALVTDNIVTFANLNIKKRLENHLGFAAERIALKGPLKHVNEYYQFPVVTRQEKTLILNELTSVAEVGNNSFEVTYEKYPTEKFGNKTPVSEEKPVVVKQSISEKRDKADDDQMKLF